MRGRWRPALHLPLLLVLLALAAFAVAESMGWRFMAAPVERFLSERLEREVRFGDATDPTRFHLRLTQGVQLRVARLYVGAPAGGRDVLADGRAVQLQMRYRDLLGLRRGGALPVYSLSADALALRLVRGEDGRANWTFGTARDKTDDAPWIRGVRFAELRVRDGDVVYLDAPQRLDLAGTFSFRDHSPGTPEASAPTARSGARPPPTLVGQARGHYHGQPLEVKLETGALLALIDEESAREQALVMRADGSLGRARLSMDGRLYDIFSRPSIDTAFTLAGPSLEAAGEPLGVTLPVTPPFTMQGRLAHDGRIWKADIRDARIGRSQLSGVFAFTPAAVTGSRSRLEGTLGGKALWLQDLGPSIGTPASGEPASREAAAKTRAQGRVLPDKTFDLPSLRVMDADVQIQLDQLELGTPALQNIRPLRAHLLLQDGVLALEDLDARLAGGQVSGRIALDGQQAPARWSTRLALSGLALERWLQLEREGGAPPYVAGRLAGIVELAGQGNSTAQILGSSDGLMRLMLVRGSVSHLGLEVAGLDLAQALGVFVAGDAPLPVNCGVAALSVREGMVRPELFVLDTPDSLLRVSGGASLATERLDLTARVSPKDVSPVSLRTPVRVRGSFASPRVSVEAMPLVARVGAAAALALVNPLAALVPLVDPGDAAGRQEAEVCARLTQGQSSGAAFVGHG